MHELAGLLISGQDAHRRSAALFRSRARRCLLFRAKDIYVSDKYFDLKLKQVDSDEGQLLVGRFAFSSSHPKK